MQPREIIAFLHARRFPMGTEKELQAHIEGELVRVGVPYEREFRLSAGDIVDFMFPSGLALEIKIKGGARQIFSQCERYCGYDRVESLVLATNRAMGLPSEINGKPAFVASLGRAWL